MTDFGMSKIATLRIIVGQTLEWNTGLYLFFFFVDFEKAFDSLDQEMICGTTGSPRKS